MLLIERFEFGEDEPVGSDDFPNIINKRSQVGVKVPADYGRESAFELGPEHELYGEDKKKSKLNWSAQPHKVKSVLRLKEFKLWDR